jgi:hypothetical protein
MGDEIGIGARHMGCGDDEAASPNWMRRACQVAPITDSRRNAILMLRTP